MDDNGSKRDAFDRFADSYQNLVQHDKRFFDTTGEYFAEYKVQLSASLDLGRVARVLDFGCGIGRSLPYLRACWPQADIFGCEPSADCLEVARQTNQDCHFIRSLADLPSDFPGFDVVFVSTVMHHIPPHQHRSVYRDLARITAPHGNLIIFEHNPYNPVTRWVVSRCPLDEDANIISKHFVCKLLKKTGWQVFNAGYSLFFPQILRVFRSCEKWLRWLPLGGQYFVHARKQTGKA